MSVIELDHLTKSYGAHRGVEDLSFTVEEGEIFGCIGPIGAGKSTVIRTLLDLIRPTAGSARLFGQDTRTAGKKLRADVGYVPSEVVYYEDMRVGQLLRYSAAFYPHRGGKQRIQPLSDYMELDLRRRLRDLSFADRKKVGIVQSLLHSPRLLLLDEPAAGLDPLMQQKLFDLIESENKRGVTVFFSSRVLSEVQRLCRRVAILQEGRLTELTAVSALRERSCCRVKLHARGLTRDRLALPGVTGLTVSESGADFLWQGLPATLLELLRPLPLVNLWISESTLDEVCFYTSKGGEDK